MLASVPEPKASFELAVEEVARALELAESEMGWKCLGGPQVRYWIAQTVVHTVLGALAEGYLLEGPQEGVPQSPAP